MYMNLIHLYVIELFNVIVALISCMCYTPLVNEVSPCTPNKRAQQEREVYMTTHKLPPIEEFVQQILETLEQKPDRDDLENGLSERAVACGR